MKVKSREYKVMLKANWFTETRQAVEPFFEELSVAASSVGLKVTGELAAPEKRTIQFFDTTDFTFRRNNLVLRRRDIQAEQESEFTLKCRNPDRYYSQGVDLSPTADFDGKVKLEEDIAAVFRSRISLSTTITLAEERVPKLKTVGSASNLFPILADLRRDGQTCCLETPLETVHGITACERVFKGKKFVIEGKKVSAALIVWTKGWSGRVLAAEFSFRYKDKEEDYSFELAEKAQHFFLQIQKLDWCAPQSPTKTQYVYGEKPAQA